MAFSVVYNVLLLVALPALSLGLLSDYKICGDAECESKFKLPNRKAAGDFYTIIGADVYTLYSLVYYFIVIQFLSFWQCLYLQSTSLLNLNT